MYVFALGTGCCGSSLIQEILARHPDVGFLSNVDDRLARLDLSGRPNNALYRLVRQEWTRKGRVRFAPSEGYRLLTREVSPLLAFPGRSLTQADAVPFLAERFRDFFDRRAAAQSRAVFLHKFTGPSRAGFVNAVFPDARFIHIVRDGRAVAASLCRQSWWLGESGRSQSWAVSGLDAAEREVWERSGRSFVLLAGLAWQSMIRDHDQARRSMPADRWLELRYEDIVADPKGQFAPMLEHMDLDWDDRFLADLEAYHLDGSRRAGYLRELDRRSLRLLEDGIGETLERLGYEPLELA